MKLIVGLGNYGQEYKLTRHNVGFIFLDEYFKQNKIVDVRNKYKSEFVELNKNGEKIFFQKPLTYMNLSGEAISEVIRFYKLDPKTDLFVIYDDMDLPIGKLKIRKDGSPAGHNGIKSIIQHVGGEFCRIKYGIGKARNKEETIGHVLGKFTEEERNILRESKEIIFDLLEDIINDVEISKLMNKYNTKQK